MSDTAAPAEVFYDGNGKKLKPARKQVKPGEIKRVETPQTGKEYNLWYNKWAGGDREDGYSNKTKAQTRCNIKRDAGWTRADKTGNQYYCLFFARGCCPYGYECNYLHQLPHPAKKGPETAKDCFGRDKFADYRDDMGGVGSFQRENRTLYLGRIKETGPGPETEEIVRRHSAEWGEIDRMRVLQYRSVAFVTYIHEANAQFAREAMSCQSMDNDEILNVRWATEDPNPTTKVIEKRRLEEIGTAGIASKLDPGMVDALRAIQALEGASLDNPLVEEVEEPPSKRRKIEISMEDEPDEDEEEGEEEPQKAGLLSAETLQGLRVLAEMRMKVTSSKPGKPGLSSLADYGSDQGDE